MSTPMANIQEIERNWIAQFNASEMVVEDEVNKDLASQLFYGFDDPENAPFEIPFLEFYMGLDSGNEDENLNRLIQYLSFIGMTIRKEAIQNAIDKGTHSYDQVVQRAHDLFKYLVRFAGRIDVEQPFKERVKDFYFFLLMEIQNPNASVPKFSAEYEDKELPEFYNKFVSLPEAYEKDKVAMDLFKKVEQTNTSMFLTGKAGTGKSTFIHYLVQHSGKEVLVLAFTGIAAINIGGQTIHSFFRLPLKPLLPKDEEITIFRKHDKNRKIIKATDIIIVDEVSMLRSDVLQAMDHSLRNNGGDPGRPFGGKQMIFVGDVFQLPPVVNKGDEVQAELFSSVYKSQYFFDAPAYRKLAPEVFEFEKIHRQSNLDFVHLLNQVRDCSIDSNGLRQLNQRFDPDHIPEADNFTIMLTSTNHLAKKENRRKLNELNSRSFIFKAQKEGHFGKDRYPTDELLELKSGAQVMFVRNDVAENGRRWVNGTIAVIEDISQDHIEVKMQNGIYHRLHRETWENSKYEWDRKAGRISSNVVGTFQQYPIKPAWAVTIHKSQGLTFDSVIIDLGRGAFVNGQLYTALSRCRTLEGIVLKKQITLNDVVEDGRLIEFEAAFK